MNLQHLNHSAILVRPTITSDSWPVIDKKLSVLCPANSELLADNQFVKRPSQLHPTEHHIRLFLSSVVSMRKQKERGSLDGSYIEEEENQIPHARCAVTAGDSTSITPLVLTRTLYCLHDQ